MWIDAHAHLYDVPDASLQQLLDEATGTSVSTIISTAVDLLSSSKVVKQCESFSRIYGAAGISPFDVISLPDNWEKQLHDFLNKPKIIALGEIGIDDSNDRYPSLEKQIPIFEHQLHIANTLDLPAVIHSRGAEKDTARRCQKEGVKRALFHCFTGNYDSMKTILDCGYFISLSGIITFKNAEIRSLVPSIPPDRLLIETDSPYLSPVPFRGKTNQPAYVKYVGEEVAKLRGVDPELLQERIRENFKKLFSIDTLDFPPA